MNMKRMTRKRVDKRVNNRCSGFTPLEIRMQNGDRKPKRRVLSLTGFTLIEMLVVSSMIVVISLAIYSSFSNGLKIWERANKTIPEEDLNILFDRFTADVRNSFNFEGIEFVGEDDRLEFITLVESKRLGFKSVGQVRYYYDSISGAIKKEVRDFSHIYRDDEGVIKYITKSVKSVKFFYYILDPEKKSYFWLEETDDGVLPSAIRMVVELKDEDEIVEFTKTVNIPLTSG